MNFVLNILEAEKKKLEVELRNNHLMHINMQKARLNMSVIAEIKQVMKLITTKMKTRSSNLH